MEEDAPAAAVKAGRIKGLNCLSNLLANLVELNHSFHGNALEATRSSVQYAIEGEPKERETNKKLCWLAMILTFLSLCCVCVFDCHYVGVRVSIGLVFLSLSLCSCIGWWLWYIRD